MRSWMRYAGRVQGIVIMMAMAALPAMAANKYSSGAKTWDTTTMNWGTVSGGAYDTATWDNNAPDSAIFEGASGTVTLGESISISNLTISIMGYTIQSDTLDFATDGAISVTHPVNGTTTISTGITGSPDITYSVSANSPWFSSLVLAPTDATMTIGKLTQTHDTGVYLSGTTTGNSVDEVQLAKPKFYKDGSGTWTIGDVTGDAGVTVINGTLICSGTIGKWVTVQNGGTFRYDNASAVVTTLTMQGGSTLDNNSGAAITSLTTPNMSWAGDWTFTGSQDLTLGGTVTLTGNRQVTVAAGNLTINGAVGDGAFIYGLTKAGDGTLTLGGMNTYEGATTVTGGTLTLNQASLSDVAFLTIGSDGILNLGHSSTDDVFALFLNGSSTVAAKGTWGPIGSGADYESSLITGDGLINNLGGDVAANTYYWDGPNSDGNGDGQSDGGSGVWSTLNANWDVGLPSREAWDNATGADAEAILAKTGGSVTLDSDVTLKTLTISVQGYSIAPTLEQNYSLNFAADGTISVAHPVNGATTISTGITGSPDITYSVSANQPWGSSLVLAPTDASMTIGKISHTIDTVVFLGGTTTGNYVAELSLGKDKLYKTGSGAWIVGNINQGIYINDGTLIAEGTISGTVRVNSGGTLKGTGTGGAVTVASGATLAPGAPTGTFAVSGSCPIDGNLDITVDGAANGTLDVNGTLTISSATLDVNEVSAPSGPVIIATYTSLVGTFATTNGADKYEIDYNYEGGNAIALVPPPAGTVFILQ